MPISLHAATVPAFIRGLDALAAILDKAAAHCAAEGIPEAEMLKVRLIDDMFPLAYQIKSVVVHSLGGIEGVRKGTFSPDMSEPAATFAEHKARLGAAADALRAMDPAEMESFIGKDMEFRFGDFILPFTGENFLLAFSQGNFSFHLTTAYAILRAQGVPVGKRDFMGAMPLRGAA